MLPDAGAGANAGTTFCLHLGAGVTGSSIISWNFLLYNLLASSPYHWRQLYRYFFPPLPAARQTRYWSDCTFAAT